MDRNLSVHRYFQELTARHRPRYRFEGKTRDHWQAWRDALLPAVRDTLGAMPEKVPLHPEIVAEWEEDGLIKQRVLLDVEAELSAAAYVFRPADAAGPVPGILACHGHGPFGKEAMMGNRSSREMRAFIESGNSDYGFQMAQAGYAVIAIDWRGFGERSDARKPHHVDLAKGRRDPCNLNFLRAVVLGRTVLGMDVHDGMCALDYLCAQDFVDADRIGVIGRSFGGTMTTWMTICDERIRAADVVCYSDRFAAFGMRDLNFCGSQITPGLFALCDVPDLQGLIAPRPLLVEIGVHDECFRVDDALSCHREVERIYDAAGARESLELDLFEGGHAWSGRKTLDFFARHLSA